MADYLKAEANGVEVYVNKATGAAGSSVSGLAAMAGVNQSTVSRGLSHERFALVNSEDAKQGQALADGAVRPYSQNTVNGIEAGNLRVIPAEVCVAYIGRQAEKLNHTAIASMMLLSKLGFENWAHEQTGFTSAIALPTEAKPTGDTLEAWLAELEAATGLNRSAPEVQAVIMRRLTNTGAISPPTRSPLAAAPVTTIEEGEAADVAEWFGLQARAAAYPVRTVEAWEAYVSWAEDIGAAHLTKRKFLKLAKGNGITITRPAHLKRAYCAIVPSATL